MASAHRFTEFVEGEPVTKQLQLPAAVMRPLQVGQGHRLGEFDDLSLRSDVVIRQVLLQGLDVAITPPGACADDHRHRHHGLGRHGLQQLDGAPPAGPQTELQRESEPFLVSQEDGSTDQLTLRSA